MKTSETSSGKFAAAAKLFEAADPSSIPEAKLFADAAAPEPSGKRRLLEMSSPHTAWCWASEIMHVVLTHQERPSKQRKLTRKWDGATPYAIHPLWCAMMILHESLLDETTRVDGSRALMHHDILEDTYGDIAHLPERVQKLVRDMTYDGLAHEMAAVWEKEPIIRLLKLYDKCSNLMDGAWMAPDYREKYEAYTAKLLSDAERNYGTGLNIVRLAHGLLNGK